MSPDDPQHAPHDEPQQGPFDVAGGMAAPELSAPSSEERVWAAVAHGVGVGSSVLLPVVVSLVIYLAKKDESEFVADQAREALNFQLTVVLMTILAAGSVVCLVGFALLPLVWLTSLIFALLGALRAYDGTRYRYPFALRVV